MQYFEFLFKINLNVRKAVDLSIVTVKAMQRKKHPKIYCVLLNMDQLNKITDNTVRFLTVRSITKIIHAQSTANE